MAAIHGSAFYISFPNYDQINKLPLKILMKKLWSCSTVCFC